jgi:hypothetical protein
MLWGACLRVPRLSLGKDACAAPNKATIIISPGRICFAMHKEASWREDHRRISNDDQVHMVQGWR